MVRVNEIYLDGPVVEFNTSQLLANGKCFGQSCPLLIHLGSQLSTQDSRQIETPTAFTQPSAEFYLWLRLQSVERRDPRDAMSIQKSLQTTT